MSSVIKKKKLSLPFPQITFISQPDILDHWYAKGWSKEDPDGYQSNLYGRFVTEGAFKLMVKELSEETKQKITKKYFRTIS